MLLFDRGTDKTCLSCVYLLSRYFRFTSSLALLKHASHCMCLICSQSDRQCQTEQQYYSHLFFQKACMSNLLHWDCKSLGQKGYFFLSDSFNCTPEAHPTSYCLHFYICNVSSHRCLHRLFINLFLKGRKLEALGGQLVVISVRRT